MSVETSAARIREEVAKAIVALPKAVVVLPNALGKLPKALGNLPKPTFIGLASLQGV